MAKTRFQEGRENTQRRTLVTFLEMGSWQMEVKLEPFFSLSRGAKKRKGCVLLAVLTSSYLNRGNKIVTGGSKWRGKRNWTGSETESLAGRWRGESWDVADEGEGQRGRIYSNSSGNKLTMVKNYLLQLFLKYSPFKKNNKKSWPKSLCPFRFFGQSLCLNYNSAIKAMFGCIPWRDLWEW